MKFNTSILDILKSRTKIKIVKFLLSHEASMSEREIASILSVSHMSVNRIMPELAAINFVDCVRIGKTNLWKVNRKSYAFKILSKLIESVSAIESPLEDLKQTILKTLSGKLIKRVILFGSIAKSSEDVDSDIDLFILVGNIKDKEKIESEIEKLSNKCYDLYGNRLAPYILTEAELNKRKDLKVISEIEKGIQIYPESIN